jgi:hypothetical protein
MPRTTSHAFGLQPINENLRWWQPVHLLAGGVSAECCFYAPHLVQKQGADLIDAVCVCASNACRSGAQLPAEAPRLLTADEEAALGSVVQQYRKLVQLHRDMPEIAAALDPPAVLAPAASRAGFDVPASSSNGSSSFAGPSRAAADAAAFFASSSSSSSSEVSSPGSSPGSSRRSSTASRGPLLGLNGQRVHANTKWPPPLSDADVQEVRSMSRAWRAMLPELAAKAQQLLVLYNTRWVV